ncbi:hypothetical protein SJAG_00189 [Schizosaccharomyces japonicus yFS275]|uniref:Uncharacterized protein n=1 Tax=Schizosaccharomyces japonicus (strain yFS275 / FY16936) TaxID=402676 RepID=B6JXP8_SCHJY|nr:hypothetical protein SJAG_00189 [Schizosaccharomyces japonicus yFS275]EEB05192.1 hypothetical protein SJAG_00189 [Schizosaccharomyces japonicus yFS275]
MSSESNIMENQSSIDQQDYYKEVLSIPYAEIEQVEKLLCQVAKKQETDEETDVGKRSSEQLVWCKRTSTLVSAIVIMVLDSLDELLLSRNLKENDYAAEENTRFQNIVRVFSENYKSFDNPKINVFAEILAQVLLGIKMSIAQVTAMQELDANGAELPDDLYSLCQTMIHNCENLILLAECSRKLGKRSGKKQWLGLYQIFSKASRQQLQDRLSEYEKISGSTDKSTESMQDTKDWGQHNLTGAKSSWMRGVFSKLKKKQTSQTETVPVNRQVV